MRSVLILSIGQDALLLRSREQVLRKFGYDVRSVSDLPALEIEVLNGDYDVVLLCHTLTAQEIAGVVNFVRNVRPSVMLIGLFPFAGDMLQLCDAVSLTDPLLLNESIQEIMAEAWDLPVPPQRFPPASQPAGFQRERGKQ